MRATANSIENLGYKIGMGSASLSVLVIREWGWRAHYFLMGTISLVVGLTALIFVRNPTVPVGTPEKQKHEVEFSEDYYKDQRSVLQKFISTCKDIFTNPTARWVTIGGMFRFFEDFSCIYFLPSFYLQNFSHMKT